MRFDVLDAFEKVYHLLAQGIDLNSGVMEQILDVLNILLDCKLRFRLRGRVQTELVGFFQGIWPRKLVNAVIEVLFFKFYSILYRTVEL